MREVPIIPNGIRHNRIMRKIVTYLAEVGPQDTSTILDFINTTTRHGTTANELSNVLAKQPYFTKVGMGRTSNGCGGSQYDVIIWDINEVTE